MGSMIRRSVLSQGLHIGLLWTLVFPLAAVWGVPPARSGWQVAWYDEFDGTALNTARWTPVFSTNPTNNSLHAYLPSQVAVADGNLVITSTNQSYQGLPYRSGQVVSTSAQRLGRWEVRAKLPTSRGMWPAIWLLPDTVAHRWPSDGEIDIMENRGDQPDLTSSAFHYGTNPPYQHSFVYSEQKSYQAGSAGELPRQLPYLCRRMGYGPVAVFCGRCPLLHRLRCGRRRILVKQYGAHGDDHQHGRGW